MLPHRRLGKTNLAVSALAFGGLHLPGLAEIETDALLSAALEAGVNLFETSQAYGQGDSECKFGRALHGHRNEVVLHSRAICRTGEELAQALDRSLVNLQTDAIDIYGVHDVNCEVGRGVAFLEEQIAVLQNARQQGKIRYLAVSGHRQADLLRALCTRAFDVVMVAVNPLDLDIAQAILPVARELDLGVIAMKPFAGGLFTEQPKISLRYVLAQEISAASVGMRSQVELAENVRIVAEARPLAAEEQAELLADAAAATSALGKYICRQCRYCLRDDGCPESIDIPGVFFIERAARRYYSPEWARAAYAALHVRGDACIACGRCEERCPYQLPIREMLREAHRLLSV